MSRGARGAVALASTRVMAVNLGAYRDPTFGPVISLSMTRARPRPR